MPQGNVTPTIKDGALGAIAASTANIQVALGVCSLGTANTLYSFTQKDDLTSTLGTGPAVDACAFKLDIAGGPQYIMPINASIAGVAGAVTATRIAASTSVMSVTGTPLDAYSVVVKVSSAGTAQVVATGATTIQISLDGGTTFGQAVTIPLAGTYVATGTGLSLVFTVGGATLDFGDKFTLTCTAPFYSSTDVASAFTGLFNDSRTWGAVHLVGYPTVAAALTVTAATNVNPIVVTTSASHGLATGDTVTITGVVGNTAANGTFVVTSVSATTFSIPATGNGAWISGGSVAPGATSLPVATAGAAMATAVSTQMASAATNFRFARAIVEAPPATDANLISAYASFADTRTRVCAGTAVLNSSLTGRQMTRHWAWASAARLSAIRVSESPGWVGRGNIVGVISLVRDERKTPGLFDARFGVGTTIIGAAGFYDDFGNVMAAAGSDYASIMNGRVMDVACTVSRAAFLPFLNSSVRVNALTGTILEQDARSIEGTVAGAVRAAVVAPGDASACSVTINRLDNILSTKILRAKVRVIPLGYAQSITYEIAFYNPALALT